MNLANPVRTLTPKAMARGGAQKAMEEQLEQVLQGMPHDRKFLIVSYSTDILMAPSESEVLTEALESVGLFVKYKCLESDFGHDSFLLQSQAPYLHRIMSKFLRF